MKKPLFTPEELAEMAEADAEIEESFCLTNEDLRRSRELDRRIKRENMPFDKRKIAEAKKAYYEANREKIAEAQKAYREANREKIAEAQKAYYEANREKIAEARKAYREANREKINAYHRGWDRKRKQKEKESQFAAVSSS